MCYSRLEGDKNWKYNVTLITYSASNPPSQLVEYTYLGLPKNFKTTVMNPFVSKLLVASGTLATQLH